MLDKCNRLKKTLKKSIFVNLQDPESPAIKQE